MAVYPDLPTKYAPAPKPLKSVSIDRSEDGTARLRNPYLSDKWTFSLLHPRLSAAEWAALKAFYLDNRSVTFSYVSKHDGQTYVCFFAAPPRPQLQPGGSYDVDVELEQQ